MNVVGIDPDTKAIHLVQLGTDSGWEGNPKLCKVEAKGQKAEDRFIPLIKAFDKIPLSKIDWDNVDWIYIEIPPMVNANAFKAQCLVIGAIRASLTVCMDIPHSLVDNGTWKKGVIGNGHATKEEIKAWAIAMLKMPEGLAQDYYDAACIAAFGLQHAKS